MELWWRLPQVLCDLSFVEAACSAGCTFDLMAAFVEASKGNAVAKRRLSESYDLLLVNLYRMLSLHCAYKGLQKVKGKNP